MRERNSGELRDELRSDIRKKHLEKIFNQRRTELHQEEARIKREIIKNSLEKAHSHSSNPGSQQFGNIQELANLYNRVHDKKVKFHNNEQIQIFLRETLEQIEYWLSSDPFCSSQGYLFMLVIIYRSVASYLPPADCAAQMQNLIDAGRFLRVDQKLKQILKISYMKAIENGN